MSYLERGMLHSQVLELGTVFASVDIPRISLLSQQVIWSHIMPKLLGEGFMKCALVMAKLSSPSSLGKIAQTISLALSRFHLVVPSMFAFTFGELTLAQRPLEYTDHYQSRNTLYMRAQDKDAYITSLIFSVF